MASASGAPCHDVASNKKTVLVIDSDSEETEEVVVARMPKSASKSTTKQERASVTMGVGINYGTNVNVFSSHDVSSTSPSPPSAAGNPKKRRRDDDDQELKPPGTALLKKHTFVASSSAAVSKEEKNFPVNIRIEAADKQGALKVVPASDAKWTWDESARILVIQSPLKYNLYYDGEIPFNLIVGTMSLSLKKGSKCIGVDTKGTFIHSTSNACISFGFGSGGARSSATASSSNAKPARLGNVSVSKGVGIFLGDSMTFNF